MQRCDELARGGGCTLSIVPARNVGQYEQEGGNGGRDGQVAGVTHPATIGVRRPVMVMDLFGNGGGGLKAGKERQQQENEGGPHKVPGLKAAPHHDLSLELRRCFRKLVVIRSAEPRQSSGRSRWFRQRRTRSTA
jgi:hypothetical protein